MASMSFDVASVSVLMNLVDDHKDEIKEADYIKICNAMKHLHSTVNNTQQHRPSIPQNSIPRPSIPQNSIPRPPIPQNSIPRPPIPYQQTRLWVLSNQRRLLDIQIDEAHRTRVTYGDKIVALKRLLENHSIAIPSFDMRERDMVPILEAMVVGIVTTRDRDRMYGQCKCDRITQTRNRLRAQRDAITIELGSLA